MTYFLHVNIIACCNKHVQFLSFYLLGAQGQSSGFSATLEFVDSIDSVDCLTSDTTLSTSEKQQKQINVFATTL